MARFIPDEIEAYSERFTSAGRLELFDRLGAETRETQTAPQMMVGGVEGAFLSFLVAFAQAKRVLEVGTFTGWSSIAMARALPPGGTLVTCDIDEETTAIARFNEHILHDERVEAVLLPFREGVTLIRRR